MSAIAAAEISTRGRGAASIKTSPHPQITQRPRGTCEVWCGGIGQDTIRGQLFAVRLQSPMMTNAAVSRTRGRACSADAHTRRRHLHTGDVSTNHQLTQHGRQ